MTGRPLEGVRVLDLTRVLAGPYCTMLLSDLGAEVVKVEQPGKGDDSRHFGPFKDGRSLYFASINREKKSISLNLKHEEGAALFRSLVPKFDVVVENFRPGVMEKLGLGYESLRELNPRLIYAASSGFGHSGPDSQKPAYDILVQALGGLMSITGWPDSAPTRVGVSIGDITAALFTAIGIVSALYQREQTGVGQKIDVAMLDCQVAILENAIARFQVEGENPKPLGNRHPTITPFQVFPTSNDFVVVAVATTCSGSASAVLSSGKSSLRTSASSRMTRAPGISSSSTRSSTRCSGPAAPPSGGGFSTRREYRVRRSTASARSWSTRRCARGT